MKQRRKRITPKAEGHMKKAKASTARRPAKRRTKAFAAGSVDPPTIIRAPEVERVKVDLDKIAALTTEEEFTGLAVSLMVEVASH
jgi:hypothetical protein